MRRLLRRLSYWLHARDAERDLRDEIELHRAMEQERLERAGMSTEEARYASKRALGNATLAAENAREVWIWPSFERLRQDLRYGLRMLRRQPMFAATAILTLALGIGATTTVFSVVEFEIWKPLPFPQPDRLVAIYTTGPEARYGGASFPELADWRARTQSFEGIAGFGNRSRRTVRGLRAPESLIVQPVTANFFSVLGQPAALGRAFDERDDQATTRTVMLSDASWRRLFGGDPQIVGRGLTFDNVSYTVLGVTPPGLLEFLPPADAYVVVAPTPDNDRTTRGLATVARLEPDIAMSAAEADLRLVTQQLAGEYPAAYAGRGVRVEDLRASSVGWNWRPLFFFLGAALFVLMLTCVNVASLLLARALRRDREFAIRRALGGGAAALARQLTVEGALLAFPAAAVGLLIATWAVQLLPLWLPADYLSRGTTIALDMRVYGFALAVSTVTTVFFGLTPAFITSRRALNPMMANGARSVGGSRGQRRARHTLVVIEVMLTFVLVAGAGLFLNSFVRLTQIPLGFEPAHRLAMRIPVTGGHYEDPREVVRFSDRLIEQARTVPGILAAAIGTSTPLGSGPVLPFVVSDRPRPAAGQEPGAVVRAVSPMYFRTLGIGQVAGRAFDDRDVSGAPNVAIVDQRTARRIFGNENPVGRELVLQPRPQTRWIRGGPVQIVGVVANSKSITINEAEFNNVYLPFAQHPTSPIQFVVHASIPTAQVVDPLRQQVLALDKDLPILTVRTMDELVAGALRSDKFHTLLIGTFALLAIVMAALGIYGAMSYAMEQRTREFGVRLALGAPRAGILGLAVGQSTRMGLIGTGLGLIAALALARMLGDAPYLIPGVHDGLIYGVSTTDPFTLGASCALLLLIAAAAGLVPARRAMRVDPVVALRAD